MLHPRINNIILVCLLSLAVIWGAVYYHTSTDRSIVISAAGINSSNLAIAFEEHVKKTVQNIDGLLLQLRSEYQQNPLGFGDRIRLFEDKSVADLLIQVSIIGKKGMMTFNTKGLPPVPLDLSDREHFRVHLAAQKDQLFISKPVLGRVSKQWSIQFTRKIMDSRGAFTGVIVLSVDPDYFSNFYKGINIGPGGAITLAGMDGVIRARTSKITSATEPRGLTLPINRPFFDPSKPAAGIYRAVSVVDGVSRIGAYRRLQDYPLVVVVLQSEEDILSASNARRIQAVCAGLLLSALVVLFGWLFWKNEKRRSDMLKALLERKVELREQNNALQATEERLQVQIDEYEAVHLLLQESEQNFRTIIEVSPIPLAMNDKHGNIFFLNKAFTQTFGYTMSDIPTVEEWWPRAYPEAQYRQRVIDTWQQNLGMAKKTGDPFSPMEIHVTCKDSSVRTVLCSAAALEENFAGNHLVVFYDITELKKVDKERLSLEKQLHQAQKMESLGVLAGGIAHDFNNILAVIMCYSSLGQHKPEKAAGLMPEIEKATERGAVLCRQMLAYAGKTQFVQSHVDVTALLDEMLGMLKSSLPLNVTIKPYLSGDLPAIEGDAGQLRQVAVSLIMNSSEAIGEEQGYIRVALTKTTITAEQPEKDYTGKAISPGQYLCLEVTDSGCGMDEETVSRLFEPFYTTKFVGRGLGMSAVLGIITAHKGAVQLQSRQGRGTTFKVYLPARFSDSTEEPLQQTAPAPWFGSGTILLVEDEPQLLEVAKALLETLGFSVIAATNGVEALEQFRTNAADIRLVLTDIGMPLMNGYQLLAELKKINPKLPIVVSSGFGDTIVTSKIDPGDMAGMISKPYSYDQLREVLKGVVEALPKQT